MGQRHKHYPRCVCHKVACADLDEARRIRAEIWAERGGTAKVRFYRCKHGKYHWTRMLDPIGTTGA